MKKRKSFKFALPLLALVVLAGCSANEAKSSDNEAIKSDEELIKDAVTKILNDPESARFGKISQAKGTNGKFACATINARNAFGGYTGDQQMLVRHDQDIGWTGLFTMEASHSACVSHARSMANVQPQDDKYIKPITKN